MKSTLKMLSILSLMAFFLALNIVSAQETPFLAIIAEIIDSKVYVSYALETDASQLQLILPKDAEIINCSANYTFQNNEIAVTDIKDKLLLSYRTGEFIENNKYFTADFQIIETENLTVLLFLPMRAILEKAYPSPEIISDGKLIALKWNVQNARQSFPVFVAYDEKSEQWLGYAIIALIAVAVLSVILIIKKRKPRAKKGKTKKKVKEELHLLESESAVIKALKDAKGELWQKQIQLKTGFSKAKLSRVIRNLEARGLVKRIPLGNTNKIKLK